MSNNQFGELRTVNVCDISPNPRQPRKWFDENEIKALAQSIHDDGLQQLIKLEDVGNGQYYIRAGERRWRAIKLLGWNHVQAVVYPPEENTHQRRLVGAMVENVYRANLNPIEHALAYDEMLRDGLSKLEIARRFHTSTTTVSHRLDLLTLEPEIQEKIAIGEMPSDHRVYNALMLVPAGDVRVKLVKRIAHEGVSIRTIEKACQAMREQLAMARREERKRQAFGADKQPAEKPEQPKPTHRTHQRTNRAPATTLAFGETMESMPSKTTWQSVGNAAVAMCVECDNNPRLPNIASPGWELVLLTVEDNCHSCSIRPKDRQYIQSVCGVCPAVIFLKKLASGVQA